MSIIGKPITSLAGGLKSQIIVTAPTGSTVTCTTPAGIILTAIEVSGTWTFSGLSALGTYTITATLSDKTKSKTVLVDDIGRYNVTIVYATYLYNEGDECTSITGGWRGYPYGFSNSVYRVVAPTFGSSSITLYTNYQWSSSAIDTNNKIDVSQYHSLSMTFTATGYSGRTLELRLGLRAINTGYWGNDSTATTWNSHISRTSETLNFNVGSSQYIHIGLYAVTNYPNWSVTISKIWLE